MSLVFLVQWGRQGNSLMSVVERFVSSHGTGQLASFFLSPCFLLSARGSLGLQRGELTEWLVESQVVADAGAEGREVEHDGPFGPVGAVRGVVGDLAQKIVVGFAELDVLQHMSIGQWFLLICWVRIKEKRVTHNPAPVRRSHVDQVFGILCVKQLAHPLQHVVGHGHGEGQLHGVTVQAVIPLGLFTGPLAADEDVVVIARHGPLGQRLVRVAGVKVGLRPDVKEDVLGNLVGRFKVLAAVEQRECNVRFGVRD